MHVCVCVMRLLTHSPVISTYAGFRHHHAASVTNITNSKTVNRFSRNLLTPWEATRLPYNHVTAEPPQFGPPNYALQKSSINT